MPYVLEINGRTVVLDDADVGQVINRLVRLTRIRFWAGVGGPDSMFSSYYHIWERHNHCHSINIFLLTMEVLGAADLPPATMVNRLRRQQSQIDRLLRPNSIAQFFDRLPAFARDQARFVRLMKTYLSKTEVGGARTVRILEFTRDTSFMVLKACAAILSGGAASGAVLASATGAGTALVQAAAADFLLTQIEHSATRLGRSMAGERVTYAETQRDIVNTALASTSNAMLGRIMGQFMRPLTNELSTRTMREIARGNLLQGIESEIEKSQIEGLIPAMINRYISHHPREIRSLLENCTGARDARSQARLVASGLMESRSFRTALDTEIERIA